MRFDEMDPNRKKAMDAALAKVKAGLPKQQPTAKSKPAPSEKDPHPDKSTIWKKGFADGKAGRMDPKASDAYGPKTSEYEAGYAAGSKVSESSLWSLDKKHEKQAPIINDFFSKHGYNVTSGPHGFMLHTNNGVSIELIKYAQGRVIAANDAHNKPGAPNKEQVHSILKKYGKITSKPGNQTALTIEYKNGNQVLDILKDIDKIAQSDVNEAMTTARKKLVKDFEKVAGYKISDKEAWYQAVNDYYKGKRGTWPDPKEFGLKESIHLNHELKPGIYKHVYRDIMISIEDDGSVEFMQPAEWEIEGDQEYLEYVQGMLNEPSYWTTDLNEAITEAQFDEAAGEKDACYHKVKSRYKVWPSAYASGALVQCRKVGAKNWGNKSKKK